MATLLPSHSNEPGQQSQTSAPMPLQPLAFTSGEKVVPKSLERATAQRDSMNMELNFIKPTTGFPLSSIATVGKRDMLSAMKPSSIGSEKFCPPSNERRIKMRLVS